MGMANAVVNERGFSFNANQYPADKISDNTCGTEIND